MDYKIRRGEKILMVLALGAALLGASILAGYTAYEGAKELRDYFKSRQEYRIYR